MTLPILIAFAQLAETFMRWLPFSKRLSTAQNRVLWLELAIWSVASIFLYKILFDEYSVTASIYKTIIMTGWLPYFLICLRKIPGLMQHIFVLGMGVICALVQHTICGIIILIKFEGHDDSEIILMQATGYLLLFAVFLPAVGRYFIKMLPSREFFNLRPIGIYIAVLPLVIVSGHLIRLADGVLVHSWTERFSRIYLPVVFFFLYQYILNVAKNYYELRRVAQNKRRLEEQLKTLKEYNVMIEENQKKISVMRHDLRHNYNLINAMLESGNISEALEHINKQKKQLEAENE